MGARGPPGARHADRQPRQPGLASHPAAVQRLRRRTCTFTLPERFPVRRPSVPCSTATIPDGLSEPRRQIVVRAGEAFPLQSRSFVLLQHESVEDAVGCKARHSMPFGAEITNQGVRFALWAPSSARASTSSAAIGAPDGDAGDRPGLVQVYVDAAAKAGRTLCASRSTATPTWSLTRRRASKTRTTTGSFLHNSSDACAYDWKRCGTWTGRSWNEVVLYEAHIGTVDAGRHLSPAWCRQATRRSSARLRPHGNRADADRRDGRRFADLGL